MIAHLINGTANLIDREFIRHPSDIPLEYCFTNKPSCHIDSVNNVSQGGLCFHTQHVIGVDQWLHLHIPIDSEHFEVDAQVKWCQPAANDNGYEVGVAFASKDQAFCARMVEQVCHIEHYKRKVLAEEGRILNGDQAAAEWISRYADSFPTQKD